MRRSWKCEEKHETKKNSRERGTRYIPDSAYVRTGYDGLQRYQVIFHHSSCSLNWGKLTLHATCLSHPGGKDNPLQPHHWGLPPFCFEKIRHIRLKSPPEIRTPQVWGGRSLMRRLAVVLTVASSTPEPASRGHLGTQNSRAQREPDAAHKHHILPTF